MFFLSFQSQSKPKPEAHFPKGASTKQRQTLVRWWGDRFSNSTRVGALYGIWALTAPTYPIFTPYFRLLLLGTSRALSIQPALSPFVLWCPTLTVLGLLFLFLFIPNLPYTFFHFFCHKSFYWVRT